MTSYTAQEAEAILKPLYTAYIQAIDGQKWDVVENFYHKNGVFVQRDGENKEEFLGCKAIAKIFQNAFGATGKTSNSISNDHYQGAVDYLIISSNYKTETEKCGVVSGEFTQIWKKDGGDEWKIYHDEYTIDN